MNCIYCGRPLKAGAKFCGGCGRPTGVSTDAAQQRTDKQPYESHAVSDPAPLYPEQLYPLDLLPAAGKKSASKKTAVILILSAVLVTALVIGASVLLIHPCRMCEKWYFGLPYKLILEEDGKTQTVCVCRECYDTFGVDESEESAAYSDWNGAGSFRTAATEDASEIGTQTQAYVYENRIGELSDETIRLANIFLSDFSELGIRQISRNDEKAILNYAIGHDLANYKEYKMLPADEQFSVAGENERYILSVTAQIVQQKAERFFGKTVIDQSTDSYYYSDGLYYASQKPAASHPEFSSVYRYKDNGDGTVTFFYKVFSCASVGADGFPDREVYKGTAQTKENDASYTYRYSACALLQKADVGAGYAPYRMISIREIRE